MDFLSDREMVKVSIVALVLGTLFSAVFLRSVWCGAGRKLRRVPVELVKQVLVLGAAVAVMLAIVIVFEKGVNSVVPERGLDLGAARAFQKMQGRP